MFISMIAASTLQAQDDALIPGEVQVVPPSPTVQELNKHIDVPVNAFNGLPEVNIPLYTVDVGQYSFPISLSYHASGLRVDENASWVGAGWSLKATGTISRTMYGVADEYDGEKYYGFLSDKLDRMYHPSTGKVDWNEVFSCQYLPFPGIQGPRVGPWVSSDSLAYGYWDSQPDVFYYSLPHGGGGKFVFDRNTASRQPVMLQATTDKITTDPFGTTLPGNPWLDPDYTWVMEDEKGIVYTFSKAEKTDYEVLDGNDNSFDRHQSAWYLTSIWAHGENVQFYYENETVAYNQILSESVKYLVDGPQSCEGCQASYKVSNTLNQNTVYALRLAKITSSKGHEILFEEQPSTRSDLNGAYALDRIIVKKDGVELFNYQLSYGTHPGGGKLRLEAVQQKSRGKVLPPHTFSYYSGNVPAAGSANQDYWGYFNGASNASRIPQYRDQDWWLHTNSYTNRTPTLHARNGALQRWSYPTGGYTELLYELHERDNPAFIETISYSASASGGTVVNPAIHASSAFTVSAAGARADLVPVVPTSGTLGNVAKLQRWDGFSFVNYNPALSSGNRYVLPQGQYRAYASNSVPGETVSMTVHVTDLQGQQHNEPIGGLRIKKITMNDPIANQPVITKEYRYVKADGASSSGRLFTPFLNLSESKYIPGGGTLGVCSDRGAETQTFKSITSNSILPAVTVQGSHIGYSRVEMLSLDTQGEATMGKTVYTFVNDAPNSYFYPFLPGEDLEYKNGSPLKETVFRWVSGTSFRKLRETQYSYSEETLVTLDAGSPAVDVPFYNIKPRVSRHCYTCTSAAQRQNDFDFVADHRTVRWYRLNATTTTEFDNTQNSGPDIPQLSTTTNHFYIHGSNYAHYFPTQLVTPAKDGAFVYQNILRDPGHPGLVVEVEKFRSSDPILTDAEQFEGQKIVYSGTMPEQLYRWYHPVVVGENPAYEKAIEYEYLPNSSVITASRKYDHGGLTRQGQGFVWSGNTYYLLASVPLASPDQLAYTSFEPGQAGGGWSVGAAVPVASGKTGAKALSLGATGTTVQAVNRAIGTYTLAYWVKNGSGVVNISVSGASLTQPATAKYTDGQWTLYEATLAISQATNAVSLSGTGILDELRLHPEDTHMTTFTYLQGYGKVTSMMQPDYQVVHYSYDAFGRLISVLDAEQHILTRHEYHDVSN